MSDSNKMLLLGLSYADRYHKFPASVERQV
jgi:hypothetical protein